MEGFHDEHNDGGEGGGYNAEAYGGEGETSGIQAFVPDDEVVEALDVEVLLTEEEEEMIQRQKMRRMICIVISVFVVVAAIVIPVSIAVPDNNNGPTTPNPTSSPTLSPSASPSAAPTESGIVSIVECLKDITSIDTFNNRGSAQWKALSWIYENDPYVVEEELQCSSKRYRQRYALATLYFEMGGENWLQCGQSDPVCAIATNQFGWLSNNDACQWHLIQCAGTNVTGINYGSQFPQERALTRFIGTFPSEIGALTDLVQINFKEAGAQGPIPNFFKKLSNLVEFNLWSNSMTGTLPDFITGPGFPNLVTVILTDNQFEGKIPTSIGTLSTIREYRVGSNKLTGRIPPQVVNMSLISYFDVGSNELTGPVPPGIFDRTELRILSLHDNRVTGSLPSNIGQLSLLERLKLQFTLFDGTIPNSLYTIPRLQEIRLRSCEFTGGIDETVGDATFLQIYDVGINPLTGSIPNVFGNIEFLQELRLDFTQLTGTISQSVCDAQGTDFGQIEYLVFDCSIVHPVGCGQCTSID